MSFITHSPLATPTLHNALAHTKAYPFPAAHATIPMSRECSSSGSTVHCPMSRAPSSTTSWQYNPMPTPPLRGVPRPPRFATSTVVPPAAAKRPSMAKRWSSSMRLSFTTTISSFAEEMEASFGRMNVDSRSAAAAPVERGLRDITHKKVASFEKEMPESYITYRGELTDDSLRLVKTRVSTPWAGRQAWFDEEEEAETSAYHLEITEDARRSLKNRVSTPWAEETRWIEEDC